MSITKILLLTAVIALLSANAPLHRAEASPSNLDANNNGMIVRLAEIEVHPQYLDEYLKFAKDVADASVAKEPGVIAIYSMQMKKDSTEMRILEIYRSDEAYKAHLATEHFKTYKQGTLHMVKSLKLIDLNQISPEAFAMIFAKK